MKRRRLLHSAALTGAGAFMLHHEGGGEATDRHDGVESAAGMRAREMRQGGCGLVDPVFRAVPLQDRGVRTLTYRKRTDAALPQHDTYGYTTDDQNLDTWQQGGTTFGVEVDMGNMARKDQISEPERDYYVLETDFEFRAEVPIATQCCQREIDCPTPTPTPTDVTPTPTGIDTTPKESPTPTPTPDGCSGDLSIWIQSSEGDCSGDCVEIQIYAESPRNIDRIGATGPDCDGDSFSGETTCGCVQQGSFAPPGTCFSPGDSLDVTVWQCEGDCSSITRTVEVPPAGETRSASVGGPRRGRTSNEAIRLSPVLDAQTEREILTLFDPEPLFVQADPDDDSEPDDPNRFPAHWVWNRRVDDDCDVTTRENTTFPLPNPPFRLFTLRVNGITLGRWQATTVTFTTGSGGASMATVKRTVRSILTGVVDCRNALRQVSNYLGQFTGVEFVLAFEPARDDVTLHESMANVRVPVDVLNDAGHRSGPDGDVGPIDVEFEVHTDLFGAELNVHDVLVELAAPPVAVTHGWSREWDPDNPRTPDDTAYMWPSNQTASTGAEYFTPSDFISLATDDLGQNPWSWVTHDADWQERERGPGRWPVRMGDHLGDKNEDGEKVNGVEDVDPLISAGLLSGDTEEGTEPHPFFFITYDRKRDIAKSSKRVSTQVEEAFLGPMGYDGKIWAHAHSMGGLVMRNYITNEGGHERIEQLSMDGTPNIGTQAGTMYVKLASAEVIANSSASVEEFKLRQLVNGPAAEIFGPIGRGLEAVSLDDELATVVDILNEKIEDLNHMMAFVNSRIKWGLLNKPFRIDETSSDEVNYWWKPRDGSPIRTLPTRGRHPPHRKSWFWQELEPRHRRNAISDIVHEDYPIGSSWLSPRTNNYYRISARYGTGHISHTRRDHLADFQVMAYDENAWLQEELEAKQPTLDQADYFVVWGDFERSTTEINGTVQAEACYFMSKPSEYVTDNLEKLGLSEESARNLGESVGELLESGGMEKLDDCIVSRRSATIEGMLPNRRVEAMHNFLPPHSDTKTWLWRFHARLHLDDGALIEDHPGYGSYDEYITADGEKDYTGGSDGGEKLDDEGGGETQGTAPTESSSASRDSEGASETLEKAGFSPVEHRPLPTELPLPPEFQVREQQFFLPSLDGTSRSRAVDVPVGSDRDLVVFTVRTIPENAVVVTVTDPDGTTYERDELPENVHVSDSQTTTSGVQTWFVASPQPGEWTLRAEVDDADTDQDLFLTQVVAIDDAPVTMTLGTPETRPTPGSRVDLAADIRNVGEEEPVREADVTATVRTPDGTTTTTALRFDDDAETFVGGFDAETRGEYGVRVAADTAGGGESIHRESTGTVAVRTFAATPTRTTTPTPTPTTPTPTPTTPTPTPTEGDGGPGFGPIETVGGIAGGAALLQWLAGDGTDGE